jgi:hypothetical protein
MYEMACETRVLKKVHSCSTASAFQRGVHAQAFLGILAQNGTTDRLKSQILLDGNDRRIVSDGRPLPPTRPSSLSQRWGFQERADDQNSHNQHVPDLLKSSRERIQRMSDYSSLDRALSFLGFMEKIHGEAVRRAVLEASDGVHIRGCKK